MFPNKRGPHLHLISRNFLNYQLRLIFEVQNLKKLQKITFSVANDGESGRNTPSINGVNHDFVNGKVSSLLAETLKNANNKYLE